MKKVLTWLEEKFAPAMNKFVKNDWVSTISGAYTQILPLILAGSLVSFYNVIRGYVGFLPDISFVTKYTFQLMALYLAGVIPYLFLEKKRYDGYKLIACFLSIGATIAFLNPDFTDGILINYAYIGPTGTMYGTVVGFMVGVIFWLWLKVGFLQDSESVPDFVVKWINSIIPILVVMLLATYVTTTLKFDLATAIDSLFVPLVSFGQSYIGFILIANIPVVLYSMGVSTWALWGVLAPVMYAGTAINFANGEAGLPGTAILCYEIIYAGALLSLGGTGNTLPLNVMMMTSKSKRLKTLGGICIAPSIFNINEPIVYGAVAWNPYLMIPMVLNSFLGSTIIYIACSVGLLSIPNVAITTGTIPAPISTFFVHQQWIAVVWWVILFALYFVIYYPFFKTYEKQVLKEETEGTNE